MNNTTDTKQHATNLLTYSTHSDTPRTDREADWGDGTVKYQVNVEFARSLERELNAANRRIEELMIRNSVDETIAFGKSM